MTTIETVKVGDLLAHPDNLRGDIVEDQGIKELRASIEHVGLLQPLVGRRVNGKIVLTAGHRRLVAIQGTTIKEVPVVIQAEGSEPSSLDILTMLAENKHRQDIDSYAEGIGYQLLAEDFGMTNKEIAKQHGVSTAHVSRHRSITKLPPVFRTVIEDGPLETYVALAQVWDRVPEAKAASVIERVEAGAFGAYDASALVSHTKMAANKAKVREVIEASGWTKPWAFQLSAIETPDGSFAKVGGEVDPTSLDGVSASALLADVTVDGYTIRKVSFSRQTTSESEPGGPTEMDDRRAFISGIDHELTVAVAAGVRSASSNKLTDVVLDLAVERMANRPAIVEEFLSLVEGQEVEGVSAEDINTAFTQVVSTKPGRLRALAYKALRDEIRLPSVYTLETSIHNYDLDSQAWAPFLADVLDGGFSIDLIQRALDAGIDVVEPEPESTEDDA